MGTNPDKTDVAVLCGPLHRGPAPTRGKRASVQHGRQEVLETTIAEEERKKRSIVCVGSDLQNQLVGQGGETGIHHRRC